MGNPLAGLRLFRIMLKSKSRARHVQPPAIRAPRGHRWLVSASQLGWQRARPGVLTALLEKLSTPLPLPPSWALGPSRQSFREDSQGTDTSTLPGSRSQSPAGQQQVSPWRALPRPLGHLVNPEADWLVRGEEPRDSSLGDDLGQHEGS